ncbi:MAG: P63C domain-containing protein [Rhodospirillaceae bacterium]|nr:P63C domain-containing protein [Rhodospirillaceae bacterium]
MNSDKGPSGRAAGGHARMSSMTPDERRAQAKSAAAARWSGAIKTATHDGVLKIGDAEIPCAVLEDGTRLLTQAGFLGALGRSTKPKGRSQQVADGLPPFLNTKSLTPLITQEIIDTTVPVLFKTTTGAKALGYRAELLPKVCNLFLSARDAGLLTTQQQDVAIKSDILIRGLAQVGIVALVDEATGYQKDRAADALSQILEAFIAKELQPWVKTFPPEFYEQMFRLRGLPFPSVSVKRPQYFGLLTNNIIYDRLAPGVLNELKRAVPRNEDGRPKAKYFQNLTANFGYSKLKEHIGAVVALMKISSTWDGFLSLLNKHYTKYGDTIPLPFDDGRGL